MEEERESEAVSSTVWDKVTKRWPLLRVHCAQLGFSGLYLLLTKMKLWRNLYKMHSLYLLLYSLRDGQFLAAQGLFTNVHSKHCKGSSCFSPLSKLDSQHSSGCMYRIPNLIFITFRGNHSARSHNSTQKQYQNHHHNRHHYKVSLSVIQMNV